ncbi:MAG: phosphotransferase [Magnetococcales bacterium]|nr:phosphotransferase [Magnetococcales bacterium]NGZ06647.1 phosphotransferase [Magnetococcales bacterium]
MTLYSSAGQVAETAREFVEEVLGGGVTLTQVAGDASFRRYFRVEKGRESWILMDAPPDKEDSHPFLDIARFLRSHGVGAPEVLAERLDLGYVLLEDFGDLTYLKALEAGEDAQTLYRIAVDTLIALQATPVDGSCIAHHRPFDRAMLRRELALFTDWYIEGICRTPIVPEDRLAFDAAFHRLLDGVLRQPWTLVHRDYHSRNLMWRQGQVGVIDFQDAVMGPITYDLASLLRDCYVAWERPFREQVMERWWQAPAIRARYAVDWNTFCTDLGWMGIQRNLKAVGIFGRLSLRDGKHGYLNDIPRTMGYVRAALSDYPELADLSALIHRYAPE